MGESEGLEAFGVEAYYFVEVAELKRGGGGRDEKGRRERGRRRGKEGGMEGGGMEGGG